MTTKAASMEVVEVESLEPFSLDIITDWIIGGGGGSGGVTKESWERDQEAYRNASDPQEKQRLKEKLRQDRIALGYPTADDDDDFGDKGPIGGGGGGGGGQHGGGQGGQHGGKTAMKCSCQNSIG